MFGELEPIRSEADHKAAHDRLGISGDVLIGPPRTDEASLPLGGQALAANNPMIVSIGARESVAQGVHLHPLQFPKLRR